MPLPNSQNPGKGRDFEDRASQALQNKYGQKFAKKAIGIGNPSKLHYFDLVSEDDRVIAECKNYSYTETGNIPSAKMAFLNEAVLYLSHVPPDRKKIIVLREEHHLRRSESLADYYKRTYRHLLDGIAIMELDVETMELTER
jgi:hypothetical protein